MENVPRPDDVSEILRELDACTTLADLAACRDKHRARVREIYADPDLKVFALHIANLADQRERLIKEGKAK